MSHQPEGITILLGRVAQGDEVAAQELFPLVYRELRDIAARQLSRERPGHTLQPTALVNELWLRLATQAGNWQNRNHFFGVAARVMRQVLIDYARTKGAQKRGSGGIKVELDDTLAISESRCEQILYIDEALTKLEALDPRQAQIVEMRFFAGMTEEEIALLLGLSERTIKREWATAKAMLRTLLALDGPAASAT